MLYGPTTFKTARELQEIAGRLIDPVFDTETAETLPVPFETPSGMAVVFLFYESPVVMEPPYPIYPPHHRLILNATTGEALAFDPIVPSTLGLDLEPDVPVEDPGVDPALLENASWRDSVRVVEISHLVWYAYSMRPAPLSADADALVREYAALFPRFNPPTVLTFYRAAAPDFFTWLTRVAP